MAKKPRTVIAEPKLEPILVGGEIVARRGVGTRIKVDVPGQAIELMLVGPTSEAVRTACEKFGIEYDEKHLGEALVVRPSFFDAKVKP